MTNDVMIMARGSTDAAHLQEMFRLAGEKVTLITCDAIRAMTAALDAPKWSRKQPDRAGWWWYCHRLEHMDRPDKSSPPQIVKVEENGDGTFRGTNWAFAINLEIGERFWRGWWAGPLLIEFPTGGEP